MKPMGKGPWIHPDQRMASVMSPNLPLVPPSSGIQYGNHAAYSPQPIHGSSNTSGGSGGGGNSRIPLPDRLTRHTSSSSGITNTSGSENTVAQTKPSPHFGRKSGSSALPVPSSNHSCQNHRSQNKVPVQTQCQSYSPVSFSYPTDEGPKISPRFEAWIMTGDKMINLANTKSSDNQSQKDRLMYRRQRTTPNLHGNNIGYGRCKEEPCFSSLPSSPAGAMDFSPPADEVYKRPPESLSTGLDGSPAKDNYGIRLSKSEDQLMNEFKSDGDNHMDDVCNQSNSLNPLISNGDSSSDENSNNNDINKLSKSEDEYSGSSANMIKTCSSTSPEDAAEPLFPTSTGLQDGEDDHEEAEESEDYSRDEEGRPTNGLTYSLGNDSSSPCPSSEEHKISDGQSSSPDDNLMVNMLPSPARVMGLSTATTIDQTESSMSEGYSVPSSLSTPVHASPSKNPVEEGREQLKKNVNTLSMSSSGECESESKTASPEDSEGMAQKSVVAIVRKEEHSSSVEIESRNESRSSIFSDIGENMMDHSYPSLVKECNQSNQTPPLQIVPSGSSSETDSGSEDEFDCLATVQTFSPPKAVDVASASRLASRLFHLQGFKKSDVSRQLSRNNDFARLVAEEYLKLFDFSGDLLDGALRKFLLQFCLIGETQERERVLVHFSKRYLQCNPGSFQSSDAVHTLTCALMLLNSDLHGENVGRKMLSDEFLENLTGLNDGSNFPRDVLRSLYQSIKNQRLEWAMEVDQNDATIPIIKKDINRSGKKLNLNQISGNPFLEIPNPNVAVEYKKGYIMRKCCYDMNGKRTPLGKRGWHMFYATLRDMVLYLHKDEQGFRKFQLYESLHNSIRVHHAFCTKATDYTKRQYVFRLQTADQAEYLFQTSDAEELDSWIDTINFVAASLSSPPLPSAVGSQIRKFQRPLLPVNHTKFNLRDQLIDHENRKLRLECELEEHLNKHPRRASSKRLLNEFMEKESHLQYEINRYQSYITLLKQKIEKTLGSEAVENLKKGATISSKSKPLTSLSIGEEVGYHMEEEEDSSSSNLTR